MGIQDGKGWRHGLTLGCSLVQETSWRIYTACFQAPERGLDSLLEPGLTALELVAGVATQEVATLWRSKAMEMRLLRKTLFFFP